MHKLFDFSDMVIVKTYLHSIRSSDLVGWQKGKKAMTRWSENGKNVGFLFLGLTGEAA